MVYEEYPPAPQFVNAVASYWRFALPQSIQPPAMHAVPPDGAVNLCWLPMGCATLVGPRVTALRVPVHAGAEYIGIRFLPGAAGPLLGIDVRSLRDKVCPYTSDAFAWAMRDRDIAALDGVVHRWAESVKWQGPDRTVAEVTRRIIESDGTAPVQDLLTGLNLSYRQLLRRFHEAAGLTPKEFARIRRFRAACLQAIRSANPQWASVSAEAGFADQSHLVREFQDIYGWPPRLTHEYLRRIDHLGVVE